MTTVIICLLSFALLLPFWDFSFIIGNYISFIPFILYTVLLVFIEKKRKTETIDVNDIVNVKISDIYKSFFLNCLFFIIFVFALYLMIKVIGKFKKNVLLLIFYVLLTQNSAVRSPGFYICKINIKDYSLKRGILLLINNLYKFSIFYQALFPEPYRSSEASTIVFFILFLFYAINFFYRVFVSKDCSLMERILGINYFKISVKKKEEIVNMR